MKPRKYIRFIAMASIVTTLIFSVAGCDASDKEIMEWAGIELSVSELESETVHATVATTAAGVTKSVAVTTTAAQKPTVTTTSVVENTTTRSETNATQSGIGSGQVAAATTAAPTQAPTQPPTTTAAPTQAPTQPPTTTAAPTQAPTQPPTTTAAPTAAPKTVYGSFTFSSVDINGMNISYDDVRNAKLIMVNMWEPWCGPCVGEMADLEALYENYASQGFLIIGFSSYMLEGFESDTQELIASNHITYPLVAYDDNIYALQTGYVPTIYFVDNQGNRISDSYIGSRSYSSWEYIMLEYLAQVQ